MTIIQPTSSFTICRDPDDDKFLNCAKDANALFIVSGDEDLLEIKKFGITNIITAKDFCDRFMSDSE